MSAATAVKAPLAACATGLDAPLPHSFAKQKANIELEKWEGSERSHLILLFFELCSMDPFPMLQLGAGESWQEGL